MNDRDLRYIGISASWLSIAVTGLVILHAADNSNFNFGTVLFILWAVAPYIGLILGDVVIRKIALIAKMNWIFCVVSILLFVFTLYAYIGTIGNKSSTYGLIFVFLPFYLNVIVIFLVIIGLVWAALSKSSINDDK